MAESDSPLDANAPSWRERALSRSLRSARSRAEKRVQRFLDAAFELIDEKGTTEFTIQEVVERSSQSLRGFYQYFHGKDELLLALFEEVTREAYEDLVEATERESEPLARLRAFVLRLHEWCEPVEKQRLDGGHDRFPIAEFSLQLSLKQPDRVALVLAPITRLLVELLEAAVEAGVVTETDVPRAATLIQQTVMYSWLMHRLVPDPRRNASAERTWAFCLDGLRP